MRPLQENESSGSLDHQGQRNRRKSMPMICFMALILLLVRRSAANLDDANAPNPLQPIDFLDENSVILITGIAGFIGSELAMALHRVYSPKMIIGVDSMDDGFGQQDKPRTAEELGIFDFKRQRLFHVLQTLGSRCDFYRADFRPDIPDFQLNDVSVLDQIFTAYPNITHVVHLADPYGLPSLLEEADKEFKLTTQAVPRKKGQLKAGMMEGLMEHLNKAGRLHPDGRVPHFTYASSSHVYSHYIFENDEENPNPYPFAEEKPITTPSSIHGASKLIDEILAKAYHETRGIYSVGLRLFDVYGPWGSPGSFLFDMAERAVRGGDFVSEAELKILDKVQRDYVYIDDAVDAILAAMQFRPLSSKPDQAPAPVVINVGTGVPTTVRTIIETMQKFLMGTVTSKLPPPPKDLSQEFKRSISYASTDRAIKLLGFESRVPLDVGIFSLLTWHYDRAFPYGSLDPAPSVLPQHPLEELGMVLCSPFDPECLRGAPIFPCASECSNRHQCTPSFYDSVVEQTRKWTAACEAVLYTVDLDEDLTAIPSASAAVSSKSQSHVVSEEGHCNVAFVSSKSPLVQGLRRSDRTSDALKHGFWTLVLVDVKEDEKNFFLEFLPKLSPGYFFRGEKTTRIIYCDPNVLIDNVPNLLTEAAMQPMYKASHKDRKKPAADHSTEGEGKNIKQGATAMLIGKGRQSHSSRKGLTPLQEAVQDMAYRSVRISVIDQMTGDGFALPLDSSFIVHTLQSEDSRLFRCDVFGELIQWEVGTDQSAFEFILELHDMWSSVIVKKAGLTPWWGGEGVVTIPELRQPSSGSTAKPQKRRLLETLASNAVVGSDQGKPRAAQLVNVDGDKQSGRKQESVPAENKAAAKGDANFGDGDDQVADEHAHGEVVIAAPDNEDKEDDDVDDDEREEEDGVVPVRPEISGLERDVSAYDTWMGVLSSTPLQYFVRIVPSSEAGVVVLDDYF